MKTDKGKPIKPAKVSQKSWDKYMEVYEIAKDLNDPFPSVTANQLALESGWFTKPSGTNNYGGQKARKGEDATDVVTHEDTKEGRIKITDRFKNYSTLKESIQDRANRWFKVYKNAKSPKEAIQMLKKANYATDTEYIDKLGSMYKTVGMDYKNGRNNYKDPDANSPIQDREGLRKPFNPVKLDGTAVTFPTQPEIKAPESPAPSYTETKRLPNLELPGEQPKKEDPKRVSTGTEKMANSYLGILDRYVKSEKAKGGELNSSFANPVVDGGLTQFNTGGTHSENKLGGIPQGISSEGKLNTVEEGETKYKFDEGEYVFSNRTTI